MGSQSEKLKAAIERESQKFAECYFWLEKAMPTAFLQEITEENLVLITHSLMGLPLQNYFSTINLKGAAMVLCLDLPDADLRILQQYAAYGIKNYQAYISTLPPPFIELKENLRIAVIIFTDAEESKEKTAASLTSRKELESLALSFNSALTRQELDRLLNDLGGRFLNALSKETLSIALAMYFRAQTRDSCQYEIRHNPDWASNGNASLQIVLAWKNTPQRNFLYHLARTIHRHHLIMKRVDATYVNPYTRESILIMCLDLHGANGKGVIDVADMPEFLRELATVKYFPSFDEFEEKLVSSGILTGNQANILRSMVTFVHQMLLLIDPNLYSLENIREGFYRHPELTLILMEAFHFKFHPEKHDIIRYTELRQNFLNLVDRLDTGQEEYDHRRKNILRQAMNMVHHTYKTNAYRLNFTALSFRLNPEYLDQIPFDRQKKFPELPYAIFFIEGMHYFGFHIRFKDLARGGLRTVIPEQPEKMLFERNTVFTECYNLAHTQHLKNKDIPEGGAKGIIFLMPPERIDSETEGYRKELARSFSREEVDQKITAFKQDQKLEHLYQAQRSFIETLITLVNCAPDGTLYARRIVDYWKRPEYIYLGPDENMHDAMINWCAEYSKKHLYKPGTAFITSKSKTGFNHKEYGVTSLGVNVYMREFLKHIGIDPITMPFTVKIAGGPDGDVAGNQILNLYKYYPNTAKLLSVVDISGTAHDPQGLNLEALASLFKMGKPIRFYPIDKLSEGGFLVDKTVKKETSSLVQQTLRWKNKEGQLVQDWLSGSELYHVLRENIHKTKTDVFIPAGGRPRTLNESNYREFLDETGKPTSKIIVEGANLYLTPQARRELEKLGALVIKDSSANKTGVICSSFEVLCGLTLGDETFYKEKDLLVGELLKRLEQLALSEANLLLSEYETQRSYLTDISAKISERINQFSYQLLAYLDTIPLSNQPSDALIQLFLNYCLPTLKSRYQQELLREIPDPHKKAIIACHVGAQLVYQKGLHWVPSIVEILPIILKEISFKSSE